MLPIRMTFAGCSTMLASVASSSGPASSPPAPTTPAMPPGGAGITPIGRPSGPTTTICSPCSPGCCHDLIQPHPREPLGPNPGGNGLPHRPAGGSLPACSTISRPAGRRGPPSRTDAEAVTALVLACDLQVIGHSDATVGQTAADLTAPGFDRERGGLLVHDGAGELVGFLWTEDEPETGAVFVDPYALDPWLTEWLLRRGMAYVRDLARERGTPIAAKSGSYDHDRDLGSDPGARRLLGAADVLAHARRPRRCAMACSRAAGRGRAAHPRPGRWSSTYVELHELFEASFADHWDHTARPFPQWREHFVATAGLDPTQWWVADVDGAPAGFLVADESRAELGMTWVRMLGVRRQYRGRGLGRLLLRTSFAQAASRGRASVGLGVDSENPTGATALYESVGMRPESVLLAWRADVAP